MKVLIRLAVSAAQNVGPFSHILHDVLHYVICIYGVALCMEYVKLNIISIGDIVYIQIAKLHSKTC